VDFLPYGRQTIEDDDIAAVSEALRGDFLTTGPLAEAFEAAFAGQCGARFAVSCSNATAGLHLAMAALQVQPGAKIVVPSITFLSTASCGRFVGADVVFCDVDPATGLMTGETLAEALDRAGGPVAAILPVHLRGDVVNLPAIRALADKAGAAVVEDAAHAAGSRADFGASVETVGSGLHGDMTVFSFHPVKTIATGEGGMVTTNDPDLAARLGLLRSHGMRRPQGADPWVYEIDEVGFNYRLPDINCALGLSQLAKLDRFVSRRAVLAERYRALLPPLAPLVTPAESPAWSRPALHLFTVLIDFAAAGVSRREVVDRLKAKGIGSQVHYIPVHTQPYYRALNPALRLPGAEAWYARALSLPLFPAMADTDPERVVDALREALGA